MSQKLSQIQGVGQVIVGGSSLPAVRVDLNPTQLNAYGLSLEDVRGILTVQNSNRPKGQLSNGTTASDLMTNDQLLKAEYTGHWSSDITTAAAVQSCRRRQVSDSVQDLRAAGVMNGKPAVLVVIFRQPGANIIDTVDRIAGGDAVVESFAALCN